jgi:hypothetical protein
MSSFSNHITTGMLLLVFSSFLRLFNSLIYKQGCPTVQYMGPVVCSVMHMFDPVDVVFDFSGYILGYGISPDSR